MNLLLDVNNKYIDSYSKYIYLAQDPIEKGDLDLINKSAFDKALTGIQNKKITNQKDTKSLNKKIKQLVNIQSLTSNINNFSPHDKESYDISKYRGPVSKMNSEVSSLSLGRQSSRYQFTGNSNERSPKDMRFDESSIANSNEESESESNISERSSITDQSSNSSLSWLGKRQKSNKNMTNNDMDVIIEQAQRPEKKPSLPSHRNMNINVDDDFEESDELKTEDTPKFQLGKIDLDEETMNKTEGIDVRQFDDDPEILMMKKQESEKLFRFQSVTEKDAKENSMDAPNSNSNPPSNDIVI